MDIDTLSKWTEEHKLNLHHCFFSSGLTFYIKGDRISKDAGLIGTMLNTCPLLNMDDQSRLIPRHKVSGKKRMIKDIVKCMEHHADNGLDYSSKCYISMSDCYDDAKKVAERIEESFHKLNGKVEINWVVTTIGSHTGPGRSHCFSGETKGRNNIPVTLYNRSSSKLRIEGI